MPIPAANSSTRTSLIPSNAGRKTRQSRRRSSSLTGSTRRSSVPRAIASTDLNHAAPSPSPAASRPSHAGSLVLIPSLHAVDLIHPFSNSLTDHNLCRFNP